MFLQRIWLKNFKNYRELDLKFQAPVTCVIGKNGMGKTNLLDAIHYLCLCKSYFNPIDGQNVNYKADFFTVKGTFLRNEETHEVFCNVVQNQRKTFKLDNVPYKRLAEHIGRFPAVMIAPGDLELITGGSAGRRRFMNRILSQFDKVYLDELKKYNKLLRQRNSLLKEFAEEQRYDASLVASYDEQMAPLGQSIFQKRHQFWEQFTPVFQEIYQQIAQKEEHVKGQYDSQLRETPMEELLTLRREKDKLRQRTTAGPHKDDIQFLIDDRKLKKFGSQGQQKSFLYALKLTKYHFLKEKTGHPPLLMLDDVFDRLDFDRVEHLLQIILQDDYGQIFLTDTHPDRVPDILNRLNQDWEQRTIEEPGKIV